MQPPKRQSPVVWAQHRSLPQELLINIKLLERVPHSPFKQAEALVCSVQYAGSNGLGEQQPHNNDHE